MSTDLGHLPRDQNGRRNIDPTVPESTACGSKELGRAVAAGAGFALLGVALWFAAVRVVGAPGAATRLLLLALAVAGATAAAAPRLRWPAGAMWRSIAAVMVAVTPLALGLLTTAVAWLPLGGLLSDALIAALWGLWLLPVAGALPRGTVSPGSGLAGGLGAVGAAVAAGLGLAALAIGGPVWALSTAAAALLFLRNGAPRRLGHARTPAAIAAAALATAWLVSIPPLLLSFSGAVPQGIAGMILAFLLGLGVGRLLLPGSFRTAWSGALLVGLSCLLTLIAASEHPVVAQLALGTGGRFVPWIVFALVSAGSLGLAGATVAGSTARPGPLAAGIVLGTIVAGSANLGAPPDLPIRAVAGLACLAAMVGLTLHGGPARWPARLGWVSCVALIAGVGFLPPLQLNSAALGAASRVPARDLDLVEELMESEVTRSGPERTGPRAIVRSSRGKYLLRAHDVWPPGESERAAEILHALLPVLAAGDPGTAAVIGLGRGDVLDPLGAANVDRLMLLDRSPNAAGQVAALGGPARDVVMAPSTQLVRSHPLPSLPLPGRALDVVVVDLPPPSLPGAQAWYGPRFARQVRACLAEDGWTAFRVHSRFLDVGDLARVIVTFSEVFPDATVWLDPVGEGDVILLGTPSGGLPDAERMIHGLTRRALRQALRSGDLRSPGDLFTHVISRADSEVYQEHARRSGGMEWRAGDALLRADARVPLARLAAAAQPLDELVNLENVAEEEIARLHIVNASPETFWPVYLEFLDVLAQGDGTASLEQVEHVRTGSDDPTRDLAPLVHQIVEGGRTAAARGQDDDAHAMFLLAAAFSPDDPEANVELGRQAWGGGNLREAIDRFERALTRDPDNLVALLGAADAHIRLGDPGAAVSHLEHAASAHPDSIDALFNLGRLYVDTGRIEDGLVQYRRALPMAPDNARIHFGLADAHFQRAVQWRDEGRSPREEIDLARAAADRSLTLAREPVALCLKGQIELVAGNYAAAEEALRESVELDPDNFESRAGLGEAFFAQHDYEAAHRQFIEAARLRPADETVQQRLEQLKKVGGAG